MKYLSLKTGVVALCVLLLASCKKDTGNTTTPPSTFANSPTCAYYHTGIGLTQYITFMDLRSPNSSEKKYFTMQLKYVGVRDSFEISTTPRSVDSLGRGFPSEIKEYPGFGSPNQWTNPQYRLLTSNGNYYKDTIVRNSASNIYFLYQNYLSGGLQGEWPQSNLDYYYVPTGTNGQTTLHSRTIFYFKKGYCLDANNAQSGIQLRNLSSFFLGAPATYDWQNVNAAIQIVSFPVQNPNPNNFYFFDFKNWRYFKWEQYMNNIFNPAQLATRFGDYQSLDNFIKWPAGWGKP